MSRHIYGFLADLMNDNGALITADGAQVALFDVSRADRVTLFVPGTEVNILSASLPARSETEARRAAPFAVEDELAVSIEDTHFALGPAGRDLQTPRAVHFIALATLQMWTDWLAATPPLARARLVAAPSMLLPGEVFSVEAYAIANIDGRAFAIEAAMPDELQMALLGGHKGDRLSKQALLIMLAGRVESDAVTLVDLRQGDFKAPTGRSLRGFQTWRLSAALAASVLVTWLGINSLETRAINQAIKAIETDIQSAYVQMFPDAPRQGNYVRAFSRAASERDGGRQVDFRDASAALYAALRDLPDVELRSLSFDSTRGGLVARVAYADYGDDAALKAALIRMGMVVNLGAVRQEADRVIGDVTLGGAP